MLEVRNLVKCYSTKGGVTVKALDNVSVKFPETGMVFLLGRSGSGKSTLLNVSGGLDTPDSGEIIVKGRSSKDFSASDFDSYRNTFVGFIFQEYNILNEFTVEQNIALALQLQNKPSDKDAVSALLKQVDLEGFAKRKPNTLSGGQKQRVAIARALIKEPEIIMADEPTGALDSNTGRQVLDTLKKLSETKLVVVVSHDREFAEFYGDRIIELKDGQIISDLSKAQSTPKDASKNVQVISDDTISIKNAEEITEEDVKSIVSILKKNKGEAIITAGKRELADVKRACKINDDGSKDYFEDTKDVKIKEYDGKKTKFIKSRLPMSHAFKMGASGLKTKPIRLIFTVLLSVVAFLMFGVVSTFTFYNPTYSISEALKETDYPSVTLSKYYTVIARDYKVNLNTGEQTIEGENTRQYSTLFGVEELNAKNEEGKGDYAGVFNLSVDNWNATKEIYMTLLGEEINIVPQIGADDRKYYPVSQVYGFSDPGADYMTRNGFNLIGGRYPQTPTEVAIPEYVANLFIKTVNSGITNASDLLNKKIKFSADPIKNLTFTIVGVYDVGKIPEKYDSLKKGSINLLSPKEYLALSESLADYLTYSFNTVIYVSQDFYDEYKERIQNNNITWINHTIMKGVTFQYEQISPEFDATNHSAYVFNERNVNDYSLYFRFYGLDGVTTTEFSINDGQIWLSKSNFDNIKSGTITTCINDIVNNNLYRYDAQTKEMAQGGNSDQFWEIINDKYNEANFNYLEQFVMEWYPKFAKRRYAYNCINAMREKSSRLGDGKYTTQEVSDLIAKIDLMQSGEGDALTDSEWMAVENIVYNQTDGYKNYCKQGYYAPLLDDISYKARYDADIIESITQELAYENPVDQSLASIDQVKRFLYDDAINPSDIDRIISVIEKWYPIVLGKPIEENDFAVTYNFPEKVYYKNYLGQTGELTVAGYFETDSDRGVEYIVNEKFINNFGKKDYTYEFEWREVESTDYVKPLDAKYNHLITLTDNSQESIENALSSNADSVVIKVQNKVYTQLELFLTTINEMKNIFLILGSVFGVFAGLMLLNFISVSISAKRKDIGILRAVGARGLDVFKIFFSEAFIIATICFIIATVGASVVSGIINDSMVTIVKMKLLNFQLINVLLVFAVSFGISIIATFFPVFFASKKSPVESIRAI